MSTLFINEEKRELITNSGTTFDSMLKKSLKIQSLCKDYNITKANSKNITFNGSELSYLPDEGAKRSSGMSRYSMSQLCSKLGVPVRYIDRCIDEGMTDLASENINAWLEDYNKNLLVREYDNRVRGILSDKYSVMDTPDILTVLDDVIDSNEYNIKGSFLTPERFHARIIQNKMMNIKGEDLFAGIQADSSDVGRSIVIVKFFIYKQVCTNGMCVSQGGGVLFEQKHIGVSVDDFRIGLKESLSRIPLLIENAKELIEASRSGEYLPFKDWKEEDLKRFTDSIKIKTKLSDEAVVKVIDKMSNVYSPTKWGLINSITEIAQEYTLERRLELEKIAGEMLQVA